MVDVVQVISEFISSLDLSGKVLSFSDDGTNTTVVLENSYHAREFMQVEINGNSYEVVSADAQSNTLVLSGVIATATVYKIPSPKFFHGSFYLVNDQFSRLSESEILPMFYMNEPRRENWGNYESQVVTPEFYFLLGDNANYQDWEVEDYYERRQIGLKKLAWAIKQDALKCRKFATIESDFFIEKLHKLGEYLPNAGADNSLFNHELTGIGLRVSIPIYTNCNC